MAKQKATYTIPEELLHELNALVEQRQRSWFVTQAIRYALELEKQKLENDYRQAAQDKNREKEIAEWSSIEVEGFDE